MAKTRRLHKIMTISIRYVDITTPSLPFDDSVSMLAGRSRNVASLETNINDFVNDYNIIERRTCFEYIYIYFFLN